jgi:glucose-6-phosphate 1-epimerase
MSENGAHLVSAESSTGELLYLSSTTAAGPGVAIRGGVPIIAPWFATFLGEPQHGWARREQWLVERIDDGFHAALRKDGIVLGYDAVTATSKQGEELRLRLTLQNTKDESQRVQFAFHPYFAVSDVENISVTGLAGVDAIDRVDGEGFRLDDDLRFDGEVDAIFTGAPEVKIVDEARTLTITSVGADSTVVWNPGRKKADLMDDIGPREWNRFVCVEPAMLGWQQEGVMLSPRGDQHPRDGGAGDPARGVAGLGFRVRGPGRR